MADDEDLPVLALPVVFQNVVERFALEAANVKVVFGWKEPPKQVNQGIGRAARVCFVPGEGESMGSYVRARAPGRNPRSLATLLETCTVFCWAYNGLNKATANDELAQYTAARLLHDAVVRAIELAMRKKQIANLSIAPFTKPRWVRPGADRALGCELAFVLTLECNIPDEIPADLGGTEEPGSPNVEVSTVQPSFEVVIAKDDTETGEIDPPPLTDDEE